MFRILLFACISSSLGSISLIYPNGDSRSFDSQEAKFGPAIQNGFTGPISIAQPSDGCSPIVAINSSFARVLVIQRGTCEFGVKVLNAQRAGYKAVLISDDRVEPLISMYSEVPGIEIPSVFVSQDCGVVLRSAPNGTLATLLVDSAQFPPYIITFVSIVASAIFMFIVFMFYRHRTLVRRSRALAAQQASAPAIRNVNLEAQTYDPALFPDVNQCCICLEDYSSTSVVCKLQCTHVFHKSCIERWLSQERHNTCPLCKRDVVATVAAATEATPLLP